MTIRIGIAMALIGAGVLVIALSIFGLFRLRDVLERIHAGALTDTMGLLLVLSGLVVLYGLSWSSAKLLLLRLRHVIRNANQIQKCGYTMLFCQFQGAFPNISLRICGLLFANDHIHATKVQEFPSANDHRIKGILHVPLSELLK